ncbi:putative Ig domain-containing protein [Thalassotalea crassostreae]|uniref:putative Ig domain-containing protein n=1 Tax=Thalassotalea crassostreae TaxID=1763536 RepID=UPI00083800E7|nr:Ig-like domain-containing protein [Thalassotalea crassostreae]
MKKYNKLKTFCSALTLAISSTALAETVTQANTEIKESHYLLSNNLFDDGSDMSYEPSQVEAKGAAFSIDYLDPGGSGMDAYVQGTVGGFKTGGNWNPSDYYLTGMPELITNLDDSFRIQWKTFQIDALDADDKWWATINVIFDNGPALIEPVSDNRDFDIVIQLERYEQDALTDKVKAENTFYYWFARNPDGSIKPFTLNIDGINYEWAVRYKFFNYDPEGSKASQAHKNDKVHIKYIPIDNNNVAPYLDHPLKAFIDASAEYIDYIDIPAEERALADEKIAASDLWVKSLSAGYEVYTGEFTIGNEYFKVVKDTLAPSIVTGVNANLVDNIIELSWDAHNDDAFQEYNVYRSVNGEVFSQHAQAVYSNNYTDSEITIGDKYDYYITAKDRSWNESASSTVVTISTDAPNNAPVWNKNSFSYSGIVSGELFVQHQEWRITDTENDPLTFALVSGPSWLTVEANGKVSGTPTLNDVGDNVFVLSVTDGINAPVEATMTVTVAAANTAPTFYSDPFTASSIKKNRSYNDSIATSATDVDDDPLTYSKVSGPDWLNVSETGALSGTPTRSNRGLNSFTVSVSDGINPAVTATLEITVSN